MIVIEGRIPTGIRVINMNDAELTRKSVQLKSVCYALPDGDTRYVAYIMNDNIDEPDIPAVEALARRYGCKLALVWP